MRSITSTEEIRDLIYGATLFGTGGGGDPEEGFRLLAEALAEIGKIELVGVEELPQEGVVVSPYYIGTIAPTAEARKPAKIEDPISVAFKKMEEVVGRKISGAVACELGGFNTAVAMSVAAKMGVPVVDGDLLGRAAPELHQCTVNILGIPMCPSVVVTETGNIVVIEQYADIDDYEALARYLSVLAGRLAVAVDTPLTKEQAEEAIIRGTISKCIEVGRAVREARERGEDPVEAAVSALGGWRIFKGVVKKYEWRDEGGFLIGEALLEGVGEWKGHILRSWIKNEHIMVWRDEKPIVMPPDMMSFVTDDGKVITNAELREGMEVNALAFKAPKIWRSPKGLELFGPRHFGFDLDYVPVEELVRG